MKKIFLVIYCLIIICNFLFSQSVGIGTTSPNASSILDITNNSKGLLIPRMSTSAITSISNPAKGLMVYDSVKNQLMVNMGTTASPNWQTIVAKSGWGLNGNSSTIPSSQFIGTTDNQPLRFRINNTWAGELNVSTGNIFLGMTTGQSNTTGYYNIATGTSALSFNTTGYYNTATGTLALNSNATGYYNTATGASALSSNTSGSYNTANGLKSLNSNTIGYYNTAIGVYSLNSNNDGNYNTAIGGASLLRTAGSYYNTAIGYNAGSAYDLGYNNTILGANCNAAFDGAYNDIAIGQGVSCTDNSQARIGNSATYSIGGYANWTNISDGRFKKDINEEVKGLDFIMKLRPVTYRLDLTSISKQSKENQGAEWNEQMKTAIAEKEKTLYSGFVAQEVEQAASDAGYDFSGVDKPKNPTGFYGLRYAEFVVPLVKAVQQQQQMIAAMDKRIEALEAQNKLLQQLLDKKN